MHVAIGRVDWAAAYAVTATANPNERIPTIDIQASVTGRRG